MTPAACCAAPTSAFRRACSCARPHSPGQSGDGDLRARDALGVGRRVLGFLHALMVQINEHMTFDEDPTNQGTSAAETFARKRGVCQDYAHIFIACARTGGCRRASSPGISCAPTDVSSRPAMPGRKPSCPISAGSDSIRPTASAPPTPMPVSRSASISRRRTGARHPLWRRHGDADGGGQGRSGRLIGTVAEPVAIVSHRLAMSRCVSRAPARTKLLVADYFQPNG